MGCAPPRPGAEYAYLATAHGQLYGPRGIDRLGYFECAVSRSAQSKHPGDPPGPLDRADVGWRGAVERGGLEPSRAR